MRAVLVVAVSVALSLPAAAQGQSSACHDAEVVFVGRADRAVTFHISGEAAIERARQNVKRVEEEVARERAALDPQTRLERDVELEVRIIKAKDELDWQQVMYPAPYDVTVFPMRVEDGIRGVTEPTVMLLTRHLPQALEPDQSYLVVGHRNDSGVVPPLPDLAPLDYLNSSIDASRAVPVTSAQQEVAFLSATRSGATILGTLRRHSWGGIGAPMAGARVILSSGGREIETVTKEDGSFAVSGIPAGRIEIRPVLPPNLTVVDRLALTRNVPDGACDQVQLTAEVNGRVRGRIISTSSRSIKGVTIHLSSIDLTEFRLDPGVHRIRSHAPRLDVRPAEDGTFEFVGVPAGSYLLVASLRQFVDGKERTLATYYPGASEQSSAIPLTVGDATEHDGFDFVVRTE